MRIMTEEEFNKIKYSFWIFDKLDYYCKGIAFLTHNMETRIFAIILKNDLIVSHEIYDYEQKNIPQIHFCNNINDFEEIMTANNSWIENLQVYYFNDKENNN